MAKKPKIEVQDEPGAEDRFLRGVRNALKMPHKPHRETIDEWHKDMAKPLGKRKTR